MPTTTSWFPETEKTGHEFPIFGWVGLVRLWVDMMAAILQNIHEKKLTVVYLAVKMILDIAWESNFTEFCFSAWHCFDAMF